MAVARVATDAGVAPEALDAAYRESRSELLEDPSGTYPPDGLRALLSELRAAYGLHVALVTNAPAEGLERLLAHLGVADVVDEVRGDARKPAGLTGHLESLLAEHGLTGAPERLLSVGDIWRNDLEPALRLGCATAYVDHLGRRQGPAHARAARLVDLYPAVREWAEDPARFITAHRPHEVTWTPR